ETAYEIGVLMNAWESILALLSGEQPMTGTYSIDVDERRIPSMVPGNTQWLTPAIKAGSSPMLTPEQVRRAAEYAQASGNSKPAASPMSPLGSEFDFYNPSGARLQDLLRLSYGLQENDIRRRLRQLGQ